MRFSAHNFHDLLGIALQLCVKAYAQTPIILKWFTPHSFWRSIERSLSLVPCRLRWDSSFLRSACLPRERVRQSSALSHVRTRLSSNNMRTLTFVNRVQWSFGL